ncbi:MAG: DNA recombination protein RmuC [Ruminococcaceae bacterium]|nr:DNA recombination protein RmuC [Oscillospiraceae bacterium]
MEPLQLYLFIGVIVLLAFCLIALIVLISRSKNSGITAQLDRNSDELVERVERKLSEDATEVFRRFSTIQDSLHAALSRQRDAANAQMSEFGRQVDVKLDYAREQAQKTAQAAREETMLTLKQNREETNRKLGDFQIQLDARLNSIQTSGTANLEKVNATLESRMKDIQDSNEKRLLQMQEIVDEKLQKTLETRLTQSFELVSRQLDSVQQGLGEMKSLASDARSLKNALTNVKERGTYGEVRLEMLLSDILAPNQYETNVEILPNKRVEFAVLLPGSNEDEPLYLPIDSKFPIEDYNRLIDAEDKQAIDDARRSLAQVIRASAKDIYEKYILPPKTTDFALMFLPTEGLYAEVLQNAALFEEIRDKYKVTPVGATTLSAFLSSLQVGFKTLAIEQRSLEVWDCLRAVKSEFSKFSKMLQKARKQLQTADQTLEKLSGTRTRAIERTLRSIDGLPYEDYLELEEDTDEPDEQED